MKKYTALLVLLFYTAPSIAQQKNALNFSSPVSITKERIHAVMAADTAYGLQYHNNTVTAFKKAPEERKKHYILRGMLIGGAIGIAPVVFGQGGAYVAIITFPAGLIIGAILGAAAKRRHRND